KPQEASHRERCLRSAGPASFAAVPEWLRRGRGFRFGRSCSMNRRMAGLAAGGFLIALVLVLTGVASGTVAPLTTVSGPDPYANCSAGGGPGATNYPDAEVEPWLAANPANSNSL